MARLDTKVVIVTGGGSGIGRAFCRRFAAEGAKVVVADINVAAAKQVVEEIAGAGGVACSVVVDVTSSSQVNAMVEQTLEEFGRIDVLVNNVGIYPLGKFLEITEDEWDRAVDVTLKSCFLCSQAVVRRMIESGSGKIINLASGTFSSAPPLHAHYIAAKGGIIGLTRAMARELGTYGINVNAISPGLTRTETAVSGYDDEVFAIVRECRCIPRDEYPEDLVGAALFFASSESDFVTGQTLLVDGGHCFG